MRSTASAMMTLAMVCAVLAVAGGVVGSGCPFMAGGGGRGGSGGTPARVDAVFSESMNEQYEADPSEWLRQAHGKQHGCLRGTLEVDPSLSPSLQAGIFVPGAQYPLFARFSNGAGRGFTPPPIVANESDIVPDTRGLALKLFNVRGDFVMESNGSQAFTFTTSPTSFLATPELAVGFFDAVQAGKLALSKFLLLHPSVAKGLTETTVYGAIHNVLTATYYTAPAQLHGETPAKYSIRPCASTAASLDAIHGPEPHVGLDPNFLTDNLIRDIYTDLPSDKAVCLEMSVQLYDSPSSTPVNDTTVPWSTPFHPLGRILFDKQFVWSHGQEQFCRHMSFNPWLSIAAHTPVGFLQDIRRTVYTQMATQRHALRGQSQSLAGIADWNDYPNM